MNECTFALLFYIFEFFFKSVFESNNDVFLVMATSIHLYIQLYLRQRNWAIAKSNITSRADMKYV